MCRETNSVQNLLLGVEPHTFSTWKMQLLRTVKFHLNFPIGKACRFENMYKYAGIKPRMNYLLFTSEEKFIAFFLKGH